MIYDLIIIGAGQAGLSAAYYAQRQNLNFIVLEANARVGDNWRRYYDSLVLFSPRALNRLPGFKFSGKSSAYPTRDEAANYLEAYAANFKFNIRTATRVRTLTKVSNFQIDIDHGQFSAHALIVATGSFNSPCVPELAGKIPGSVRQLTASQYKTPNQIPVGKILVVGGGHSGATIASELATAHQVTISVDQNLRFISRATAKLWFYFLYKSKAIYAHRQSVLGQVVKSIGVPLIGSELKRQIHNGQVKLKPAISRVVGENLILADDSSNNFETIIWATGYRSNFPWIKIPGAVDSSGAPLQSDGLSPVAGLYYVGLDWQRSRASALMGGVGRDARFIVDCISEYLEENLA